jgi:uncharacterized membrane protein YfcA
MTWFEALVVFVAGVGAGTINAVVGSGTLITFPALLAVGLPPVVANVSNTAGLAPGSLAAAYGYRRELRGQRSRLTRLVPASFVGTLIGAVLLLALPSAAFDAIVPALILLGCVLVMLQPRLARLISRPDGDRHGAWWVWPAVLVAGVYGGYFGAAQGVLLMAILGIGLDPDLQRMNAIKNVLAMVVNAVAATLFVLVADIDWTAALLIAAGSTIGGFLGAAVGRRLPAIVLRIFIVVIGVVAVVAILF